MSMVLATEALSVRLGHKSVLHDIALTAKSGDLVALVGPNGAGKTTLLRALAGLVPAEGHVRLDGTDVLALTARQRARSIAYLPQRFDFAWDMRVADVVSLGLLPFADALSRPPRGAEARVARALDRLALQGLAERNITTLSGGEKARVALARLLVSDAPVILADEPTAALDPAHQLQVLDLFAALAKEGRIVIVAVHDLAAAMRHADQIAMLKTGALVALGTPADVLTRERLAEVFGIEAQIGAVGGVSTIIPVRALPR